MVFTCPGEVMVMTPAHMHMHMEELLRAGCLPIKTVGDPGVHGAVVAGMQGMGVNTPSAAAVAEATVGFAMDMHIPNVGMLVMGIISMMGAAGVPATACFGGRTVSGARGAPQV